MIHCADLKPSKEAVDVLSVGMVTELTVSRYYLAKPPEKEKYITFPYVLVC